MTFWGGYLIGRTRSTETRNINMDLYLGVNACRLGETIGIFIQNRSVSTEWISKNQLGEYVDNHLLRKDIK